MGNKNKRWAYTHRLSDVRSIYLQASIFGKLRCHPGDNKIQVQPYQSSMLTSIALGLASLLFCKCILSIPSLKLAFMFS